MDARKIKSITLTTQNAMDDTTYRVGVGGCAEILDWGQAYDQNVLTCYAIKNAKGNLIAKIEYCSVVVNYFEEAE
jgi:hypothetical protein